MTLDLPDAYLEGIRLFNAEDFFECHDVLEELWAEVIGDERAFLQGMIQSAVALFHFGNENLGGARKMYETSRKLIEPYEPRYMAMDVEKFLSDMKFCFEELLTSNDQYPEGVVILDERVPKIVLDSTEQADD